MRTKKAIGIDIGTTSICLVSYCVASGKTEAIMQAENAFCPGTFRQDPQQIYLCVKEMLDRMIEETGNVDVIGVSSQMHGILYLDKSGNAVTPYYTWKTECGDQPFKEGTYAKWLSDKTGYAMHTGYGSVTHFFLQETNQIPEEADVFTNIGDYLVMRLCDLKLPQMHSSIAASMGGFRLEDGSFDFEKLQEAGINTAYYPKVNEKVEIAGMYQNIPVVWAVGDNQASFYAAAGEADEMLSVNVGTGSQVSFFDRTLLEVKTGEIRPFTEQGYLYVQASVNGGKVYERLAEFFQDSVRLFTGIRVDKAEIYQKMEEAALEKPETELRVFPLLYGSRTDKDSAGTVEGLTAENFYPADVIRAYTAGMARELYEAYRQFPEELRRGKTTIVASGNGIRRNRILRQDIERAFGMPVILRQVKEEAAAGAAMWAWQETETRHPG